MMNVFRDAAEEVLGPFLARFGLVAQGGVESPILFLSDRTYCALGLTPPHMEVRLGDVRDGELRSEFLLSEIVKAECGDCADHKYSAWVQSERDLRDRLIAIRGALEACCEPVLRGDPGVVRRLERAIDRDRARITVYYETAAIRRQADDAWKMKRYSEFVAAYERIESHLTGLERRKLAYARRKLAIQS